ncbi:MAG: extracellular solute-binding protein [Streptosporangiales bacterium]|nr:extracellular solute-binding protein [Streptosporangiales bacterium]
MSDPMSRRGFLHGVAGVGTAAAAGPLLLTSCAGGEQQEVTEKSLQAYQQADIDWKQASGVKLKVAIIAANPFANLSDLLPQFKKLTGIDVTFEEIPPPQIRHKVILDFSSDGKQYHTSATDPMYYPLYAKNKWIVPLTEFLDDPELTDKAWLDVDDILPGWRQSVSLDGTWYGMPYDGEVTVQIYRTDLYDEANLKPAQTLAQYAANAKKLNKPGDRVWGAVLRGTPGAGQNMYIWPSIFREFGGEWFDKDMRPTVNSDAGVKALEWYIDIVKNYAPKSATNWNWTDIADAFASGTVASYLDASMTHTVLQDETKSTVAEKLGFARWPAGPDGTRVSSIWNWSFPINADFSRKEQIATWLFIQWATCKETQTRTSLDWSGARARSGVNRTSITKTSAYKKKFENVGRGFLDTLTTAFAEDQDPDWRPRVPEWPKIGDRMATAVQSALTGQEKPKEALDNVNKGLAKLVKES